MCPGPCDNELDFNRFLLCTCCWFVFHRKGRLASLPGTSGNFSLCEALKWALVYYSFSSFFFFFHLREDGRFECASISLVVNSFHVVNCRELYWNPLKLKSQPTWMLWSRDFKCKKSTDIRLREFSATFAVNGYLSWVPIASFAYFSVLRALVVSVHYLKWLQNLPGLFEMFNILFKIRSFTR